MKTIHFLPAILLFLSLGSAIAQTPEGNQRALNAVINSEILDEDRDFVIYLPDDYYTSENQYPVLYILDGRTHFHHATGAVNFLSVYGKIFWAFYRKSSYPIWITITGLRDSMC
jgi:hypothetical protein